MYEYKGPATVDAGEIASNLELEIEPGDYYIELKVYKNKPKATLTAQVGPTEFDKYVSAFWSRYPKRNGKHLNKRAGQNELNKISSKEIEAVLRGAENFAKSKQARDGFAPDAYRWLRRKSWEEWQDGEEKVRNRATL